MLCFARFIVISIGATIVGCIPEPRLRPTVIDATPDGPVRDSTSDPVVDGATVDDASGDGPVVNDVPNDVLQCDGGTTTPGATCLAPPAPRLRSPLATSLISSGQTRFRWFLPPGVGSVQLSVCADRICSREVRSYRVDGDAFRVPLALDRGVWFWRLRSVVGNSVSDAASATWSFTVLGNATRDVAWDGIPDLDGDGRAELIVGAPDVGGGAGRVYVYTAGALTSPGLVINPPTGAAPGFGARVSVIGDINGDGAAELAVVSASGAGDTDTLTLIPGGTDGLRVAAATVFRGTRPVERFARRVLRGADLNGDGFGDLIVVYAGVTGQGIAVEVMYGSANGAIRREEYWPSPRTGFSFPLLVAAADIDDDGYGDIIAGGVITSLGSTSMSPGFIALARGSERGPNFAAPIFIDGLAGERFFGQGGLVPGDWNGDGYLDVLVGTRSAAGVVARIFAGSASGLQTSPVVEWSVENAEPFMRSEYGFGLDLNDDGRPEWLREQFARDPPSVDAPAGWQVVNPGAVGRNTLSSSGGLFPPGVVAAQADYTGDGVADLVIGDPAANTVSIYAGRAGGPSTTPTRVIRAPSADMIRFGASIAR